MINISELDINELVNTTSSSGPNVDFQSGSVGEVVGEVGESESLRIIPDINMSALSTQRYTGAPWFNECKNTKVLVFGAGGISSWTVLALSRLCLMNIVIYDSDNVSPYNLAGQFYRQGNIGDSKVRSLNINARMFSPDCSITGRNIRIFDDTIIDADTCNSNIAISGVDSMRLRKSIYNCLINSGFTGLYIDGRLSADTFQVICFDFNDVQARSRYQSEYLFDDSEALESICSFKQTTYMAMMIGAFISNLVVNAINNKINLIEYNLPFFTEYSAIQTKMESKR